MKKFFILFLLALIPSYSLPCTTFFMSGDNMKIFGRNYDFQIGKGLLIVNKKNVVKESPKDKNGLSAKWISGYGSITFNQYGREYPTGGMNEAGLVVELMWLEGTQYPEADSRPAVNVLQWIQYQLDNCSTIQEVINTDSKIRISKSGVPLHYLIADMSGNTAVIEFENGKMNYRTTEDMPFKVLTNDFYSSSIDYLSRFKEFGGSASIKNSTGSLDRFAKACKLIKEYDNNSNPIDYSFNILNEISQPGATQWSIVYDLQNSKIYFRTMASPSIKNIDFSAMDFDCGSVVKVLDVDYNKKGNINTALVDYSQSLNYDLIKFSFSNVDFLKNTPEDFIKNSSTYPETFNCFK